MQPMACWQETSNEPRDIRSHRQDLRPDLDDGLFADCRNPRLQSQTPRRTREAGQLNPAPAGRGGSQMTDDPRLNPQGGEEIDPHTGHREVDPVTGYDTTGHDWNGIRELNTPFPKIALWALALSFAYSVVAW